MTRIVYQASSSEGNLMRSIFPSVDCDEPIKLWAGTWNIGFADPFEAGESNDNIIKNLIPRGYDMYVLGVQEGVSDKVYRAVGDYLNGFRKSNKAALASEYTRLPLGSSDSVYGYGDGAFTSQKFTGIGVFVKSSVRSRITEKSAKACGFGLQNGSKGGVVFKMTLDGRVTIAFVNCHLEANNISMRRKQITTLNRTLSGGVFEGIDRNRRSSTSNIGNRNGIPRKEVTRRPSTFDTTLTNLFDHVIWMGDLNYRINTLDPNNTLKMLKEGEFKELHDRHDSLLQDMEKFNVFPHFTEAKKHPEFCPSYKKIRNRGNVDMKKDASWPKHTYVTKYKVPLYKRIFKFRRKKYSMKSPGWTDRILLHSKPSAAYKIAFEDKELDGGNIRTHNYNAVNEGLGMDVSDHSPVYCTFFILKHTKDVMKTSYLERELCSCFSSLQVDSLNVAGHSLRSLGSK